MPDRCRTRLQGPNALCGGEVRTHLCPRDEKAIGYGRGMRIIWYTAMSMDGRIASAEDSLGFLELIGPSEVPSEVTSATRGGIHRSITVILGVDAALAARRGHGWAHDELPYMACLTRRVARRPGTDACAVAARRGPSTRC